MVLTLTFSCLLLFLVTSVYAYYPYDVNGRCYMVSASGATYTNAKSLCTQGGMRLVEFSNDEEAVAVAMDLVRTNPSLAVERFWVQTLYSTTVMTPSGFETNHYWTTGEVTGLWKGKGVSGCAVLVMSNTTLNSSDVHLDKNLCIVTFAERFICEALTECIDSAYTRFEIEGLGISTYYISSFPSLFQESKDICSNLGQGFIMAWFYDHTEMTDVANYLDSLGLDKIYSLEPEIEDEVYIWGNGTVMDMNNTFDPDFTFKPCARFGKYSILISWGYISGYQKESEEYFIADSTCAGDYSFHTMCRKHEFPVMEALQGCIIPEAPNLMTLTYHSVNNYTTGAETFELEWACVDDECVAMGSYGNATQTCLSDGNWSGIQPFCYYNEDPTCSLLSECPANVHCEVTGLGSASNMCGMKRVHTCQSGFSNRFGINQFESQCVNGHWQNNTSSYFYCNAINSYKGCREFPKDIFSNESIFIFNNATSEVEQGGHVVYGPDNSTFGYELCQRVCFTFGYYWTIILTSNTCGCLHPYENEIATGYSVSRNNTMCDTKCVGDPTQFCGGQATEDYFIGSTFYSVGSCYKGELSRPAHLTDSDMVHILCVEVCKMDGFEFSVINNDTCFCASFDELVTSLTPVAEKICSTPCPGIETSKCGGSRNSFTVINADLYTLPTTCQDLFDLGVHKHGTYLLQYSGLTYCTLVDGTECEENWLGFSGKCLKLVMEPGDYWAAQAACLKQGAYLANSARRNLISSIIFTNTRMNYSTGWWFGDFDPRGLDLHESSNGRILENWSVARNSLIYREKCLSGNRRMMMVGETACGNNVNGYICEKDAVIPHCLTYVPDSNNSIHYNHPNMSGSYCVQKCRRLEYLSHNNSPQVALLHNQDCLCVEEDIIIATLDTADTNAVCDIPCPRNEGQACGSSNKNETYYSAYPVENAKKSCNDLYMAGIDIDDYYVYYQGNQTDMTENFCNFTLHKLMCPDSFFFLEDSMQCVRPSKAEADFNSIVRYCAGFNSLPVLKLEEILSNSSIRNLLESLTPFSIDRLYLFTGLVDPYNSNTYVWIDGSLAKNMTLTETPNDINKTCIVWEETEGVFEEVPCEDKYSFVCVQDLRKRDWYPGLVEPKSQCVYYSNLTEHKSYSYGIEVEYMTWTLCIQICKGKEITYAVVQGNTCRCYQEIFGGSGLSAAKPLLRTCGLPCTGNDFQHCGDITEDLAMVFVTEMYTVEVEDCMDLFSQGIRVHDEYVLSSSHTTTFADFQVYLTCYGTDPTMNVRGKEWVSWNDGKFHYLFLPNIIRGTNGMELCWTQGYGAYPVSIVNTDERDFIRTVLAANHTLRNILMWETGFNGINYGFKRWMHPDLYIEANLIPPDSEETMDCKWGQNCFMVLPYTYSSGDFIAYYTNMIWSSSENMGLICKTTTDFVGCMLPPQEKPFLSDDLDMTTLLCQELCRGKDSTYAAVSQDDCYCTDSNPDNTEVFPPEDCNSNCSGQIFQYCGGEGKALWYTLADKLPSQTARSCSDIHANGLYINATYVLLSNDGFETRQNCRYECHPLWDKTNATLSTNDTIYKTNVTLTCPNGQLLEGDLEEQHLVCQIGGWSAEPKNCTVLTCSAIDIQHAAISTTEIVDGTVVSVTCHTGYQVADYIRDYSVTCSNRQWTPQLQNCYIQENHCSWASTELHFQNPPLAGTLFYVNTTLTLLCEDGYRFAAGNDVMFTTCTSTDTWTPTLESCRVFCDDVIESEVKATVTASQVGWEITLTCFDGYILPYNLTTSTHSCYDTFWTPQILGCAEICDDPIVSNGGVNYIAHDLVELVCNKGYALPSLARTAFHVCFDGEWSPELDQCEPLSCPSINTTQLNVYQTNHTDTVISLTCMASEEYFVTGIVERVHVCENGYWTPEVSSCKAICPTIVVDYATVTRETVNGQEVTRVDCDPGYASSLQSYGSPNVETKNVYTCVEDFWEPSEIQTCVPATCEPISIENTETQTNEIFLGAETLTAQCLIGYQFSDGSVNKTFLCNKGDWSPKPESCVANCDPNDLNDVKFASLTVITANGQPLYQFDCDPGYQYKDGSTTSTTGCGADGLWHEALRNCSALECEDIRIHTNAVADTASRVYSTVVHLSCPHNYVMLPNLTSELTVQCDVDGQWSPLPLFCTRASWCVLLCTVEGFSDPKKAILYVN